MYQAQTIYEYVYPLFYDNKRRYRFTVTEENGTDHKYEGWVIQCDVDKNGLILFNAFTSHKGIMIIPYTTKP